MSHFISLRTAIEMTSRYRTQKENVLDPAYRQRNILPVCETFDLDAFNSIIAEGAKKIRIYFSMNEGLQLRAIVVGVNSADQDILPPLDGNGGAAVIVEEGQLCPPLCPPASPLNS